MAAARSAANPSSAPMASATPARIASFTVYTLRPSATPAPANAPAVKERRGPQPRPAFGRVAPRAMTGMDGPPLPPGPRPAAGKVYGAKAQAQPGDGSPVLSGLIVSVLLAVGWAFLVYVTDNPVGLIAWGV